MDSGHPAKYVMLNDQPGNLRPPPQRRNVPRYHQNRSSGGKCCLRCICCCYCFLLFLILALFGSVYYLFQVYKPEPPSYSVANVEAKTFNANQQDLSISAELAVSVKAENPNVYISFIYGKESSVSVLYQNKSLCSGQIPAFHQPADNTTMINIMMKGKTDIGSGLQDTLLQDQKEGSIPLLVMVRAPVSVVIAGFPMEEVIVFVNCSLVVDNLMPNKKVGILSSEYSYGIGL